ncbi:DNA methyltransferase [Alicyclobacillus sendaiensis]|uniref:DNA methyltransferase n=1 Tax=Alicyclobacillus sendaiensis TaxID=192387 RepID=UPI000A88DDF9|nr:DNA methyltransferase [Alicyclobacillus sendaiensis]
MNIDVSQKALTVQRNITLRLKGYIQPFERILARAELMGLMKPEHIDDAFSVKADDEVCVSTDVSPDYLRKRLAYWEWVGTENESLQPTKQVLYESFCEGASHQTTLLNTVPLSHSMLSKTRKLRYGVHDIHEYRGKFFPQLVKALINSVGLKEGSIVLDPTCGSGTTNAEARAMGMKSIGFDLNPLSVKISTVKTAILSVNPSELETSFGRLRQQIVESRPAASLEACWSDADLRYLRNWFDEKALQEIAGILVCINSIENTTIRDFFLINLSNILRSVSWQKEADLRVRKEVWNYEPGIATERFISEAQRQIDKIVPYITQIQRDVILPEYSIVEGDARCIDRLMPNEYMNCDVLITSPPYATALPYIDTDRLSLVVLGLLPRKRHRDREYNMIGNREISERQRVALWNTYLERKSQLPDKVCDLIDSIAAKNHVEGVGFRRRNLPALLSKYFLDMYDAMSSARRVMKPNSYAFYVVGNNSTVVDGERVEIPTDEFLWDIGEMAGWTKVDTINMELIPSRDIFRNNRGTAETILIFRS